MTVNLDSSIDLMIKSKEILSLFQPKVPICELGQNLHQVAAAIVQRFSTRLCLDACKMSNFPDPSSTAEVA